MKELNSVQMGTASGAIARLPRPVDFGNGRGCARLRVEASIPVKNTTAGALDYTGARAKKAIECLFKTTFLKFGDRSPETVDTALDFARAREMCLAMTGDDFIVIGESGKPVRLSDLTDAAVLFTAVAAGATKTMVVEFVRPFEVVRLGSDAYRYCPGASQMRQIQWETVRGSTFDTDGNFSQGAAADLLFMADDFETTDDKWAAVPRLYQQEEAGRVSHGPKGRIGLLALWDYNAVGASTALSLFSITRDADVPLHDNANAKRVVRDAVYTDPTGSYDVNGVATVLHNLPAGTEPNEIPTGAGFKFEQTGTELNPPRTAWLHVPAKSEEDVDRDVGANVEKAGEATKLVSAAVKSAKSLTQTAAALEPSIVTPATAPDFEAIPGRVYQRGAAPVTHLPQGTIASDAGAMSSAGGSEAAAAKVATAIAKSLPGGAAGQRGARSSLWTRIQSGLKRGALGK